MHLLYYHLQLIITGSSITPYVQLIITDNNITLYRMHLTQASISQISPVLYLLIVNITRVSCLPITVDHNVDIHYALSQSRQLTDASWQLASPSYNLKKWNFTATRVNIAWPGFELIKLCSQYKPFLCHSSTTKMHLSSLMLLSFLPAPKVEFHSYKSDFHPAWIRTHRKSFAFSVKACHGTVYLTDSHGYRDIEGVSSYKLYLGE